MLVEGRIVTGGEKARIHGGLFGVRLYDKDRAFPGYTLFAPAYGYRGYLMDMNGLLIHSWPLTHTDQVELLADGNLLTHNDGAWLEELAPDGSVVWRWEGTPDLEIPNHHDFCRVSQDEYVLLARVREPVRPGVFPPGCEPEDMRTDLILRIRRSGEELWRFNFGDHVERLCELAGLPLPIPYARRLSDGSFQPCGPADWAHANTVEVLPATPLGQRDPRFRPGNVLVSFRALDTIAVVDPELDEFVWAWGPGVIDGQHQPTMLENGNILLFDNGTYRGHSIVREIDPAAGKEVWRYENGDRFFSPFRSGSQRLSNGNTFICECDAGHLFEVTPTGEIVWDFYNPFVAQGPSHLGKRMHRATRYAEAAVEPLLARREDRIIGEVHHDGSRVVDLPDLVRLYQADPSGVADSTISYTIHQGSEPLQSPVADWDASVWRTAATLDIGVWRWQDSGHHPRTQARVLWDEEGLAAIFRVEDRWVRAVAQRFGDPVSQDSCVEFFVSPYGMDATDAYFNFELSCNGTLLTRRCSSATERGWGRKSPLLAAADAQLLRIASTLSGTVDPEIETATTWCVAFYVPFELFDRYFVDLPRPQPGSEWKGNLYKCAGATSHPHWGTWAPIELDRPGFHSPAFFRPLRFG
jgi:hypothetical protein